MRRLAAFLIVLCLGLWFSDGQAQRRIGGLQRGGSAGAGDPLRQPTTGGGVSGVDTTPPTVSTAVIGTDGTTLTLGMSETVTRSGGTFDVDCSTAGVGLTTTYSSGSGSNSLVYTLGTTVNSGDTCNLDYNGAANGIEDGTGNDLASITDKGVTNNSTQGTSYCTAATTCTATTPGQCDVLCEDFEGSSYCVGTSGDQKCRSTWTAIGAIGTIDWTTAHGGTLACTDKGSNALQFTISGDGEYGYSRDLGADKGLSYATVYFRVVSHTIASPHTIGFLAAADSTLSTSTYILGIFNDGGTLRLKLLHSDAATAAAGSSALTVGTWYRATVEYNRTGGTAKVYLDGNTEITVASGVTGTSPHYTVIGHLGAFTTGETLVMQVDNIAVDDDTIQGACNQ